MSWSITVNDLQNYEGFPYEVVEQMLGTHLLYPADMDAALKLAKSRGFASATLSGGRTPNPNGRNEVVVITITGIMEAKDFVTIMKELVVHPEATSANPSDQETARLYQEHIERAGDMDD